MSLAGQGKDGERRGGDQAGEARIIVLVLNTICEEARYTNVPKTKIVEARDRRDE